MLLRTIIRSMESVEDIINLDGSEKKQAVMAILKEELGGIIYDRYYLLITETIDFVCEASKKGIKTTVNQRKKQMMADCTKLFSCVK